MLRPLFRTPSLCLSGILLAIGSARAVQPRDVKPIDFNNDIRPLLSDRCFACHGPDAGKRKAALNLATRDGARSLLKDATDAYAIVPGDRKASAVWQRISARDPDEVMPPPDSHLSLSPDEVARIGRWIDEGASWDEHWAFKPVVKPAVPTLKGEAVGLQPIDVFVRARLREKGLEPSPEADRTTLLRRLSQDLTGLPPSPEELQAFLTDSSPKAYEKQVDRLLASPHFGEQLALPWLDAARYADSHGYQADWPREMWPWRDWVVKAFNQNMPFDQFTIEQLAGDLLPDPTQDQLIATGFNRNHRINDEGGSIADEFQVEYVIDRVDTTSAVWMGLTMGCCRCHNHKYDPLSQEEFYRFFAYFNNVPEKGKDGRNGACAPYITILPDHSRVQAEAMDAEIASLKKNIAAEEAKTEKNFSTWLAGNPTVEDGGRIGFWPIQGKDPAGLKNEVDGVQASIEGEAIEVPGPQGKALAFAGKGNVLLGDVADIETTDSFSGALWIKVAASKRVQTLVGRMDEKNKHRGWDLVVKDNHTLVFHLIHAYPENLLQVATKDPLPKDTWCHIAFTYSGTGNASGTKLYVNGKAVPTTTAYNNLSKTSRTEVPLRLGQRNTSLPLLTGALDDVSLYNRVLSSREIRHLFTGDPMPPQAPLAKFVRVEIPGRKEHLSLAEVEVFHWGENIAPRGNALQSSVFNNEGEANLAIDGNHDGRYAEGRSITHTDKDFEPWWELDLIDPTEVHQVVIWNRTDGELGKRLNGAVCIVQDGDHNELYREEIGEALDRWEINIHPMRASELLARPDKNYSPGEIHFLKSIFLGKDSGLLTLRQQLAQKETDQRRLQDKGLRVMVMQEMETPRTTYLLQRGQYDQPDTSKALTPGTPAVLPPPDASLPPNRLQLARWLVSPNHPLTSRVTVNRFWNLLFGTGLVKTVEDFGVQAEAPSHPLLLDWLAADFMEHDWDIKRFFKQVVLSATYRQESHPTPALLEADPENRLLARGPRFRLTGHAIRDQALRASGLMNEQMGGPPVRVYQPPGLWKEISFQDKNRPNDFYTMDTGDALYRRSLYVYWKRSVGPPMLANFDAARRETCVLKTSRTNTPLQALNLLNDTTFLEASRILAERMIREGGSSLQDRITFGHTLLLSRAPNKTEMPVYVAAVTRYLKEAQSNPEMVQGLLAEGEHPFDASLPKTEIAAYALLASVMMNLDEAVTKE